MSNDTREALAELMTLADRYAQSERMVEKEPGAWKGASMDRAKLQAALRAALATQPAQPSAQGEPFTTAELVRMNEGWRHAKLNGATPAQAAQQSAQREVVACVVDLDGANEYLCWKHIAVETYPDRPQRDLIYASAPAAPAQAVPLTDEQIDSLRGLDTASRVRFYEHDYYALSNFSAFTLVWKGIRFDTSEAAYHFEKFTDCDGAMADVRAIQWGIRTAPSAHEAFKIAERNRAHRRPDWDDVKVGIMLDILRAKAEQHEYVRRKLLATGDRELVEDSWRDDFWGWGPNRDGKNMLGRLWMQVRSELRGIAPKAAP